MPSWRRAWSPAWASWWRRMAASRGMEKVTRTLFHGSTFLTNHVESVEQSGVTDKGCTFTLT
ncbi:hypothetical protein E2C01_025053 [Portunus trituberculatus]|uniref:Uncharacterized protein n=1 Tax=Portunus trituberculatus TaxID=210409 RepID=A0A5B7EEY8_PORTR|nr:hypothetical protein [Portunus trituberculatus]